MWNEMTPVRSPTPRQPWRIICITLLILVISVLVITSKMNIAKKKTAIRVTQSTTEASTETTAIPVTGIDSDKSTEISSSTTMKMITVNDKTTWQADGVTVAGGHRAGIWLDQLDISKGMDIDDDLTLYIADKDNHRVVRWTLGATTGELVAGGNRKGSRLDQLDRPSDVIIDRNSSSLIICDMENSRLLRVFHHDPRKRASILLEIRCDRLALDNNGVVYISDERTSAVKRWKEGDAHAIIIAGGNGRGNALDQFNYPDYLHVDEDYSVYVSDSYNHRVMKWTKDAKEGVILADGRDTPLNTPTGLTLDHAGNIYVVTQQNPRVIRFSPDSRTGTVVAGGFGTGQESNQLYSPEDILFDRQGNLYVVDCFNYRVQKFLVNHQNDSS